MPLTDTKIRTFKTPDKPVKLADGGGLHLYCSPIGRKYWRMNYAFEHKTKLLSFGEYPGITLQRAREKRMEARRLLDEGIDPGALKKAAKEAERAEITETFRNRRFYRKAPGHGHVPPGEVRIPDSRRQAHQPN